MDYAAARANMVEHQIRACRVLDPDLLDFLSRMPRERFVPEELRSIAYMEGHVPLPCGQEMLSPLQEARILQQLALSGDEEILLIGAGSGYLTALLAMQARFVLACEIHRELVDFATRNLRDLGIDNARVIQLNGLDPEACEEIDGGPFDVLVIAAAVDEIPRHLRDRVAPGGEVIAFVGSNPVVELLHQRLLPDGGVETTRVMETLLADAEGAVKPREFVF
ncbi:MAG: protein-L-isoaspartate O-methyltransferase [Zetaproteobacteria bacterium]|nr:MAG: protein-L-isoaspartate O-methyltransferase [Zetaproteobacteria bacterium]